MSTSKIYVGQNQGPGGQCADCFGAALDCQGRDSGQITAGEVGGMKYLGGSCSLFENRKLVIKSSSLLVFKFSALRKVGKTTREMGLAGRARRVQSWVL